MLYYIFNVKELATVRVLEDHNQLQFISFYGAKTYLINLICTAISCYLLRKLC